MTGPLQRPADTGAVDADNPWPGLASFREADHDLFYGRETETQEILRLALRERLTVLFGLSGLGKTSLLRAGLFPTLRQENVLPVYIRLDFSHDSGLSLAGQVREAILREAAIAGIEAPAWSAAETLWESLHRQGAELWSPRNRIVTPLLVFDQFEEIFTLGRGDAAEAREAEAFLAELADLCEGSPPAGLRARLEEDPAAAREFSFARHPYKILLSLREDFLPELEGLRGRIRSIVHNRYRLRRMNGENAVRVVTQAGGHLVEEDVPARIVRFVAGRESEDESPLAALEIEPALLSVVCRELNNKRRAQGLPRITAGLVQGNRDEILSDLYERSIEDLGPGVRSFVEERLLTKSGFRDSVALENAIEMPGVTREALDTLTDRRLLRIEEHGGIQRLELTHDVLTGVIRKSRDSRREGEAHARDEAARQEAERKLRRSRIALGFLALVLLGVIALAAWGFAAQRKANQALALADVGKAWFLRNGFPAQSLAHLAHALRIDPDNTSAQSLLIDLLLGKKWPVPDGELRLTGVALVTLSDDGQTAAAVAEEGTIHIWDSRTLKGIGIIEQEEAVESLDLGPGGRRVLVLSPGAARLRETATGRLLWRFEMDESSSAHLSPDGRWLAWSRDGRTLGLREIDAGRVREIPLPVPPALGPYGGFANFQFSPDSRRILAFNGLQILLWDVASGRSLPVPGAETIQSVRFTPDGLRLLVAGDETLLWDPATETGRRIAGPATQAWLSPAGDRVVTYDATEQLQIGMPGDPFIPLSTVPLRDLLDARFSADGRLLLTTSEEGVRLWETTTGLPVSQELCDCLHGRFLAGERKVVTGDDSGVLRLWSPDPTVTGTVLVRSADASLAPVFSEDGSRLAMHTGGEVRVWNTETAHTVGTPIRGLDVLSPGSLGLSADGRILLERRGATFQMWDTGTGKPVWQPLAIPPADTATAEAAAASHLNVAQALFALQSADDTVQLHDLATGRPAAAIRSDERIVSFTFTPAGDRLVTIGADGGVRLWNARTGQAIGDEIAHESTATSFDISPDGTRMATGTRRGLVRIWDLRTGRLVTGLVRHRYAVDAVHFQLDGRQLLVRGHNLLRLWDVRTGRPAGPVLRTDGPILQAELGPGGTRLLVSSQGDPIRLLDARLSLPLIQTALPSELSTTEHLSPSGQLLWVATPSELHVFAVPLFPEKDQDLLVRWAEAVAGWTLDDDGRPLELDDQLTRIDALRRETAKAPPGQLGAASLIRWFLADPATRAESPLFAGRTE